MSLRKKSRFLSSLSGLLKFKDYLSFLFIQRLSFSKPFYSILNYASTANIEEVMKFYNLGDQVLKQTLNSWGCFPPGGIFRAE